MKTLGLEFSTDRRSAAIWVSGNPAWPAPTRCATQHAGRATRAFTLVLEALDLAGVTRGEIERIAIGLGPGSATGIRTAIAMAQGWQIGRRVGFVGVSSLECLAAHLQAEGMRGEVGLVADAQRGEFHLATYALDHAGWLELSPLRLASVGEVQALLDAGTRVCGPGAASTFAGATDAYADATTLARLGASREALPEGTHLDAIHLRHPCFARAPAATIR